MHDLYRSQEPSAHPRPENVEHEAKKMGKEMVKPSRARAMGMIVQTSLRSQILEAQEEVLKAQNLKNETLHQLEKDFEVRSDGVRYFKYGQLRSCEIKFGGSWDDHLPLVEFSYHNGCHTSVQCAPYKALYRRKCRSPLNWLEVGKSQLTRPGIVQDTKDKIKIIQQRLKILERIGSVSYKLNLPPELSDIHDTFHASNLKKCLSEETLVLPLEEMQINDQLRIIEEPIEILDQKIKQLRRSKISIVKVSWNSKHEPEFTWERKDFMKNKYPQLFTNESLGSSKQ
ncbi:hypothetical protein OSB04_013018 [Centaurea solstitialis]|uniref:Tf2-1-like SH3-like domain-containing protein n=1 Tax=Centaurea solstitialis TaxID=347529 RepID=A0AA38TCF8_9ASTR|nr:hypothetical protein OSB04_013018 [Centaurea solstitialis]